MQWYEKVMDRIEEYKFYSHKELIRELKELKPDLSDGTYNWTVSRLVRDGKLVRQGYDTYCRPNGMSKMEYVPLYSRNTLNIIKEIHEKNPCVQFTVFETVMMNEFLENRIQWNSIFIQVEKNRSLYVFRLLQGLGYQNLMYKPSESAFSLYLETDSVIVTDLISEAPLRADKPSDIMLEKMLVDMVADKLISATFSKEELPDVFDLAQSELVLNKAKMLRYARRRNREKEVSAYLAGEYF